MPARMDKNCLNDKKTGSFYTPHEVVDFMVKYANRRHARRVLEPSAGDGRFIRAMQEDACELTAIEIEPAKADKIKNLSNQKATVYCDDYLRFALTHEDRYDLIIGNPPYISKKKMEIDQRESSIALLQSIGLPTSIFQNLWVAFIIASIKLLSDNGAIFFILPFEFLQVQYAEKLRVYIEERFNTIEIITFTEKIFKEIEQDICLV
jgi:adenine-specific DNA-methyltransferase